MIIYSLFHAAEWQVYFRDRFELEAGSIGTIFSIDAMTDPALIDNNFNGKPVSHVETMDLARKENIRRQEERDDDGGGMFGF